MKLCRFRIDGKTRIGCLAPDLEGKVLDVSDIVGSEDLMSFFDDRAILNRLDRYVTENGASADMRLDQTDLEFLVPVQSPGKIVCLAGNYGAHIAESGYQEPEGRANFTPQLFLKPATTLLAHGGVIELGKTNVRVGWETELAVVIGKSGRNIKAADADRYIFGYTILNDISERGLNSGINERHMREMDEFCDWLAGKWFDGFAPCGPWLVTKDEVPYPHALEIKFYLNGDLRQHGSTQEMIFSISEQIEYVSSIMTLKPGDIISTGTPAGAGLGGTTASLADGDELVCEIEGIGRLVNTVRWTA
jgi:2-keto-4-pentenoate hydratase/2-oxohepta-3-ene-1,7-dioic acid hydratase in catechol pathway